MFMYVCAYMVPAYSDYTEWKGNVGVCKNTPLAISKVS